MKPERTLSDRARALPASPIRRLAPFAAAARKSGKKVYQLNIGQPDIATPRQMLVRLKDYDLANIAYGPSEGLPEFIETLVDYHRGIGLELAPEEIFVTTGGSEALLFVSYRAAGADRVDELPEDPHVSCFRRDDPVPLAVARDAQDSDQVVLAKLAHLAVRLCSP